MICSTSAILKLCVPVSKGLKTKYFAIYERGRSSEREGIDEAQQNS